MNAFQIVAISLLGVLGGLGLVRFLRVPGARSSSFLWMIASLLGCLALYAPNRTSELARWLGIERGADLVGYSTTLALLGTTFLQQLRDRRLGQQITVLTREIALLRAREPAAEADAAPAQGTASPARSSSSPSA